MVLGIGEKESETYGNGNFERRWVLSEEFNICMKINFQNFCSRNVQ